ncbi:semaphorin-2A-like [Schistocerca cancellata]|uniref:semaphorin-2A-like n=1 Tax=Schistocerca cancellata TaxID=274614 RepID=UPI0021192046|nr:semaphorin-2A-like [Schistocerca cancellata]
MSRRCRWQAPSWASLRLLLALLVAVSPEWATARRHRSADVFDEELHVHHLRHHRGVEREFSCGRLFYRTFHLDEHRHALYVGAMDRIFKLNLNNISHSHCERDSLRLDPTHVGNCVSKGKSEHFDCRNHIRVIQPMDGVGSRLYVCGTNAHSPRDWIIHANLSHAGGESPAAGSGPAVAKCPYDPADNSTALWVRRGNPGGLPGLYSGTNAEFTKGDTLIFRADLHNPSTGRTQFPFKRTLKYDSKWLDKPDFVGSFESGEHVVFFLREPAVEYINCGKRVYSRVARVCKADTGGKNVLAHNWATFLKARLNCSLPGEFPFYFDEIQSVYRTSSDSGRFHAAFTTPTTGLRGSAICSFLLRDMQRVFDEGRFKEQASSGAAWLPVLTSRVPTPRPGSCVNDTRALPDAVLNFIRSHPLMDSAVPHEHGRPIFYVKDVLFTRLVVDAVTGARGQEFTVYFAGTTKGQVYKVAKWLDEQAEPASRLVDVFDVTPGEPIRAMEISKKHESLYVSSDGRVRQVALPGCARLHTCAQCVQDPYCGWDARRAVCAAYRPGLLQAASAPSAPECEQPSARRVSARWGQSVLLACFPHLPPQLRGRHLRWLHRPAVDGQPTQLHHRRVSGCGGATRITAESALKRRGGCLREMPAAASDTCNTPALGH